MKKLLPIREWSLSELGRQARHLWPDVCKKDPPPWPREKAMKRYRGSNEIEDAFRAAFLLGFDVARNHPDLADATEAWDRIREEIINLNEDRRPDTYHGWAKMIEVVGLDDP
jgi:hypothetical protein